MRLVKPVLLITVLCLLFSLCSAGMAEDEIISAPVDIVVGEAESIGNNGLYSENEMVPPDPFSPNEPIMEQKEVSGNENGDFQIKNGDTLTHYGGIDKNVVIPDEITTINNSAFQDDEYIESVIIPNSVTTIGSKAFYGCSALKSVIIPNSVTTIGRGIFYGCISLESVQLSNSLTVLPEYAFANCTSLESITIPNNVTIIGDHCFKDCDSLVNVELPDSVTTIAAEAFGTCVKLESVFIPASVKTIDRDAFKYSNRMVILGDSGSYAERYASAVGIPFNASIVTIQKDLYAEVEHKNINGHPYAYINQTYQLKAEQHPAELATTLKWSSSDTSIATVEQDGTVTGVGPGTAIITAATADGRGRAAQVDFIVPESTSIKFTNDWGDELSNSNVIMNETTEVYVSVKTQYSHETGIEMPVSFASSDGSIIQVQNIRKTEYGDYELVLKGCALGKATISATTPDNGSASLEIEVVRPALRGITLNKTKASLGAKDTLTLKAVLTPADAATALFWESSKPSVAKVSPEGVVTGQKKGTAIITVTAENGRSASAKITVKPAPKKVTLYKGSAKLKNGVTLSLKKGKSLQLKAKLPSGALSTLTWKSSKPTIAKVSRKGKVTALKKGTATITVKTANGKKATVKIKVK